MPSLNTTTTTTTVATVTLAEVLEAFREKYPNAPVPAGQPTSVEWREQTGEVYFTWEEVAP